MQIELRDMDAIHPYESNPRLNDQADDDVGEGRRIAASRSEISGVHCISHVVKELGALRLDGMPMRGILSCAPISARGSGGVTG